MVEGLDMTLEQIIQKNREKEKESKMREQQHDVNFAFGRGGRGTGRGNVTGGGRNWNSFRGRENRAPPPWTKGGGGRFSMDRNASSITSPYFMLPPPPPPPPPPPSLLPTPPPPPPLPPVLQERLVKTTAVKRKLYVSNLHFEVTQNDIKVLFSDVGPLESYILHYDKSGRSKGTAEVVYEHMKDAAKAYIRYNHLCLDGRKLKLEFGVDTGSPPAQKDVGSSSGLNQRFSSSAPSDVGDKYKGTYAMPTPENEPTLEAGEWARFRNAPLPRENLVATYGSGASQLTDDYQGFQRWDDLRGSGPQRTDWKQVPVTYTDDSRGFPSRNFRSADLKQVPATFTNNSSGFQYWKQGADTFIDNTKGFQSRNFRIQGPQRADWNRRKVPDRQKGYINKKVSAKELDADLDNYCKRQRKFSS